MVKIKAPTASLPAEKLVNTVNSLERHFTSRTSLNHLLSCFYSCLIKKKNVNLLTQAQFIAQSIGQAFQVAYMEFLKANGIEDHSFVKEMDYQEVLNSQEIFGDELQMFAKKEMQKEVKICIIELFEMLAEVEVVFVWKEIIYNKT